METGQLNYAKLAFERVKTLNPDFDDINEKLAALYLLLKDKKNFMKYNRLCKHPLELEKAEQLKKLLENDNQHDLVKIIKQIFEALQ